MASKKEKADFTIWLGFFEDKTTIRDKNGIQWTPQGQIGKDLTKVQLMCCSFLLQSGSKAYGLAAF